MWKEISNHKHFFLFKIRYFGSSLGLNPQHWRDGIVVVLNNNNISICCCRKQQQHITTWRPNYNQNQLRSSWIPCSLTQWNLQMWDPSFISNRYKRCAVRWICIGLLSFKRQIICANLNSTAYTTEMKVPRGINFALWLQKCWVCAQSFHVVLPC